ncbi:histone deacetylase family protein [Cytophaga aurantiaca]|uniref:histone deacetylase family protein n=1 Tax=Cytophaga aurantiaca TaxID=29530 RepID=UPI00036F52D1|nr:histone deacetylase [Cytophaga aurantiaca]
MLNIAFHPAYNHPVPEGHRFPMLKYDLIAEQLLYEGTITESNLFTPLKILQTDLLRSHDASYVHALNTLSLSSSAIRKTGFELTHELVTREEIIMQGTIDAAVYAMNNGIGMNIAGGTHHAYKAHGEGFCLYNDIILAADYLLAHKLAKQVLVVDLDVHQGNGTAKMAEGNAAIFTFSMHGASNYPAHKEQSDLDVALPDKTADEAYLKILKETLPRLIDQVQPDHIFFQSGVDVLATDKLGKLSLTREGCKERDRYVLNQCKQNKIPVTISLGGGYSESIIDIVEAHCNTFRLAQELYY